MGRRRYRRLVRHRTQKHCYALEGEASYHSTAEAIHRGGSGRLFSAGLVGVGTVGEVGPVDRGAIDPNKTPAFREHGTQHSRRRERRESRGDKGEHERGDESRGDER
jgi:hypothetical protein